LISSSACNKGNQKEILPLSSEKKKKNKETLHNGKGGKMPKGRRKLPFNVTVPVAISL
jgi:hypothetical protein